jgi:hypothetical protein
LIGAEIVGVAPTGHFGVDRLLTYGGEPQPVPSGVVQSLIEAADTEGNIQFDFEGRADSPSDRWAKPLSGQSKKYENRAVHS